MKLVSYSAGGSASYGIWTDDGIIDLKTRRAGGGESIRKALLRTPIDGARLSSGFGMRRHPILGYSLMHKGSDFAAPTGTPVGSVANGEENEPGFARRGSDRLRVALDNAETN